jgi:hypothetical protein
MSVDTSIVGWRAWYSGGKEYNSKEHRWQELPSAGVLMFVLYQKTRPYRRVMVGVSFYWHVPDKDIYACDNAEDAQIPVDLDASFIKRGEWVDDPQYNAALEKATATLLAPDESGRIEKV